MELQTKLKQSLDRSNNTGDGNGERMKVMKVKR